jgi:hypothetical protein
MKYGITKEDLKKYKSVLVETAKEELNNTPQYIINEYRFKISDHSFNKFNKDFRKTCEKHKIELDSINGNLDTFILAAILCKTAERNLILSVNRNKYIPDSLMTKNFKIAFLSGIELIKSPVVYDGSKEIKLPYKDVKLPDGFVPNSALIDRIAMDIGNNVMNGKNNISLLSLSHMYHMLYSVTPEMDLHTVEKSHNEDKVRASRKVHKLTRRDIS